MEPINYVNGQLDSLVVWTTNQWAVNQRRDCELPGYLIVGAKDKNASNFTDLSTEAWAELGPVLAKVTSAPQSYFAPRSIYIGRYGHASGFSVHFHVVTVHPWIAEAAADIHGELDGPEMMLYVSESFTDRDENAVLESEFPRKTLEDLRESFGY